MSDERTLSDCCDELARLLKEDRIQRISDGSPILFFMNNIENGETPAMALAMVKNQFELSEDAYVY